MRVIGSLANQVGGGGDTEAPSTPDSLTATAINRQRIDLAWDASTDNIGVVSYQIFRDGGLLTTTSATSHSDTTVQPSTSYTYTLTASDAAGNSSGESDEASATTPANAVPVWESIPDQDLVVGDAFQLNLNDFCTDADGDDVEYSIVDESLPTGLTLSGFLISGTPTVSAQAPTVTVRADDGFTVVDTTITFATFAHDATAPPVPTGLNATAAGQSQINLTWNASVDVAGSAFELVSGTQDYRLYRSTDGVNFTLRTTTTSTAFSDTGLAAGTTYHYKIAARDVALNESAQSDSVSATTDEAESGLIFVPPTSLTYQPAVEGGAGFGMQTTHCLGPNAAAPNTTVLTCNSLSGANSGSGTTGTLAWCLSRPFPRYIEFTVSGTIRLDGIENIDEDYVYIAGETAPSPGIFIRQGALNFRCEHFVCSHLHGYMGEETANPSDPDDPPTDLRNSFGAALGARFGVFSNCTGFWGVDATMQVWNGTGDITFWQCQAAESLDQNGLTPQTHAARGILIGGTQVVPARISVLRTDFSMCVDRHPLSRATTLQVADCIVYNWGRASTPSTSSFCMRFGSHGVSTQTNVESCLFLHGPDNGGNTTPLISETGTSVLEAGSGIFQANNRLVNQNTSMLSNPANVTNWVKGSRISSAWSNGYNPTFDSTWTNEDYVELHRRFVGATPVYTTGRRSLQYTWMRNYLAGSGAMGSVIDSLTQSGTGWSVIPSPGVVQNTITHTASGAHGGDPRPTTNINDIMPSGKSRLMEWNYRRTAEMFE